MRRRPRDVRAALALTLAPEAWTEALRQEAKTTLWALARPEEWPYVETFLNTIMVFASPLKDGFHARMSNPLPPVLAVEDFMMARGLQTRALNTGSGAMLYSDFLTKFDALLTEWVATEKRKDKRDWSKPDEEIANWIGHLMLTPDSLLSNHEGRDGRVSEREAKRRLLPHIAAFLERRQSEQRLPVATVSTWLTGVLAAWSALVRRLWPVRFSEHLTRVRSEL